MSEKKAAKPPVASFGPYRTDKTTSIEVAVWKNETSVEERKVTNFNVTLKRSYRNEEGEWVANGNLRVHDLPALIHGLQKAHGFILDSKNGSDE